MPGNTIKDDRPRLIGGPRDGATIAPGTRPTFIWVGGGEKAPRVFIEESPTRDLYRFLEIDRAGAAPREVYVYAGHTHRKCEGCLGFVSTRPKCAFCGHVAEALSR